MSNPIEEDLRRSGWSSQSAFSTDPQISSNLQNHRNDVYGHNVPHPNICFSSSSPLSESYSVLPVGHGNFLKVYHSNESEQPPFNNYELFSSNSILSQSSPLVGPSENPLSGRENISQPQMFSNNENTTNMIINKLVTNWSPNLTGGYSQFGEEIPSNIKPYTVPNIENLAYNQTPIQEPNSSYQTLPTAIPSSIMRTSKTNGSFVKRSANILPEVKKRIVAEVKPMRMSYSDVLSKVNNDTSAKHNGSFKNNYTNADLNSNKSSKIVSDKMKSYDRKMPSNNFDDREMRYDRNNKKYDSFIKNEDGSLYTVNGVNINLKEKKRSPIHEIKESAQNPIGKLKKNGQNVKNVRQKSTPLNGINLENNKKRSSTKRDGDENDAKPNIKTIPATSSSGTNSDKELYYNVTKTEISYERQPKYTPSNNNSKKTKQTIGISSSKLSNNRFDKQNYSKRCQNKIRKNHTYELISKFMDKWLEYTLKVLTWLFYLIYDIVVLGFCMAYERLCYGYANAYAYLMDLHKDLKTNSGKPNVWIKTTFRKFDCRFKKNSKWAFWRTFYEKKREEPPSDFYKNGRLPQTGDEAMYSLLNCKGKDAYSILGVSADSSQEQIRKHYKKIAVLVHPDKNKQPGAEEAFKVLQRAFELVGEPENRRGYDQSLVEALNAEKAWSELHYLLAQLQTKITEAANTIRCSSCGLRHPRKKTDRPHYAARECSSCKIRHSAREGDIWAETSCFGLRWKYLALMEGKVYDITEWANCQKGALSHLQPNSHVVQYRIVRGGQQQQQQQQANSQEKEKFKRDTQNEPSLDEFLDNLYSGQNPQGPQNSTRKRFRRN